MAKQVSAPFDYRSNFDSGWTGVGPVFGTGARVVAPPRIFQVLFTPDKTTLIFILGDPPSPSAIRTKSQYRVYFAPINLASPAQIANPQIAYGVFQQAGLVDSTSAPQNGGNVRISNTLYAGLDGWFFATAVNLFGVESGTFDGPVRNPIVGTNDGRVPPDVFDQAVVRSDGGFDSGGRQIVKLECTAKAPSQGQGVSTVTVTNGGTGYTHDFIVTFTGGGGSGARGMARLEGDSVLFVEMLAAGNSYTSAPTPDFSAGDGTGAAGTALLTTVGSFSGYQIYLFNYNESGDKVEGPFTAQQSPGGNPPAPGDTVRLVMNLLADSPPSHAVTLYFVSLSQTGTRRDDWASSPTVVLTGGVKFP